MSHLSLSPTLFESVSQSNLPSVEKSQLTRLLQELTSPIGPTDPLPSRGNLLVQLGQSSLVGGGLGLLHSELKEGLDVNGIPIDLVLATLSGIGGIIYRSEGSTEIAKQALTVYSFRTTNDLLTAIKTRRAEAAQMSQPQSQSQPQVAPEPQAAE